MHSTDAVGKAQTCRRGKTGGDPPSARRQQPIGAPKHRVLFVNERRQPKIGGREHSRDRRVATETDDDGRRQLTQHLTRLNSAKCQFGEGSNGLTRSAAELPDANAMGFNPYET
jgi:hypothetical protein